MILNTTAQSPCSSYPRLLDLLLHDMSWSPFGCAHLRRRVQEMIQEVSHRGETGWNMVNAWTMLKCHPNSLDRTKFNVISQNLILEELSFITHLLRPKASEGLWHHIVGSHQSLAELQGQLRWKQAFPWPQNCQAASKWRICKWSISFSKYFKEISCFFSKRFAPQRDGRKTWRSGSRPSCDGVNKKVPCMSKSDVMWCVLICFFYYTICTSYNLYEIHHMNQMTFAAKFWLCRPQWSRSIS